MNPLVQNPFQNLLMTTLLTLLAFKFFEYFCIILQLKDTVQLSLLQQSEYLRRFSLTFCEKVRRAKTVGKNYKVTDTCSYLVVKMRGGQDLAEW
jgi:hypothetical protein